MYIILKFTFGACVGSFVYCLAEQLLANQLNIWRRSCCMHCQQPLHWYDLIPVCSAILLRFRCRYCQHTFTTIYWWAEIVVGFIWVTCSPTWASIIILLLVMSYCDIRAHWVPDTFQTLLLIACLYHTLVIKMNIMAFLYAGGIFLILFAVYQVCSQYIGGGDIKLIAILSLIVPFEQLSLLLMFAGMFGLLHFALLSIKQGQRPQAIPFIPSLALSFGVIQLYHLMTH